MKLKTNKLSAWLAALAFVVMAPMAQAAQFVSNGEFKPSLNIDWTTGGVVDSLENRPGGDAGAAEFGYDGVGLVLSQGIFSLNELPSTFEFYLKAFGLSATSGYPDGFGVAAGAKLDNNGDPTAGNFSLLTPTAVADGWVRYSGSFSGVDSFTLFFTYTSPDIGDGDLDVYLDGVSITQQVPEPGSLALMGLALASIAVVRRRKA